MSDEYFCEKCGHMHTRGKIYKEHKEFARIEKESLPNAHEMNVPEVGGLDAVEKNVTGAEGKGEIDGSKFLADRIDACPSRPDPAHKQRGWKTWWKRS